MSFSSEVKEELCRRIGTARHCRIAETAAILTMLPSHFKDAPDGRLSRGGHILVDEEGRFSLRLQTENASVSRKYFTLLRKTFNINTEISISSNPYLKKNNVYTISISDHEDALRVLEATKLAARKDGKWVLQDLADSMVYQKDCCKRAFLRGAFLAAGSISAPEKFYHFEIVCQSMEKAEQLQGIIRSFQIDVKIVLRKKAYVVYVKEGAQIVELLGIMEANVALMNLENIRILKEMRNSVNRKVNCEAANINKTVSAAVRQIDDIRYIEQTVGLSDLGEGLEEIARLRLAHPDATLKELGMLLSPQVGKSGVNHRLRKISMIAEELRGCKEAHHYDKKTGKD